MSETTTADGDRDDGRSRRFWVLVAVVGLGLQLLLVLGVGAVVSSIYMPLSDPVETTPTVSFSGEAGAEYVLTHEGGDSVEATNVSVLRNGEELGTWAEVSPTMGADDEVRAGDRVTVPDAEEDDTITVVWRGEASSATMFEDEVGPLRTPTATPTATETPQHSSSVPEKTPPETTTVGVSS